MVKTTLLHAAPAPLGSAPARIGSSAIRDLLALTRRPDVISLAGGLPNEASFPVDAIAEVTASVMADDPLAALQYGPTEGTDELRAIVAHRAGVDPAHVLVTSGSQQALDLVARAVLDPGDVAVVADPAYVGALQALRATGAALVPVASDSRGLRVEDLAALLDQGLRPSLVHVVAAFDNPTGATLDARRRIALVELAEEHGFWIVDDDPYGELRWRGLAPAPLRSLSDRVITLGSTSKVLCPGLRVGWAIAPRAAIEAIAVLKQATDLHTSSFAQAVVARLLGDDAAMDAHLATLRDTYRRQADALADALQRHLPGQLAFARPDGGMFLWARLAATVRPGVSTADLLPQALDHGVAFVPGAAFAAFAAGDPSAHHRHLRLSFASASPAQLDEAARRLARSLDP